MMTPIGKIARFWIFLFLISCGPATFEDLRFEGEALVKKLVEELRAIETKEDLQKANPRLKKRFNQIADLLIEAKKFSCPERAARSNPGPFRAGSSELYYDLQQGTCCPLPERRISFLQKGVLQTEPSFVSEELFSELARIYEMSGGRELIEMAQNEAVQKLKAI